MKAMRLRKQMRDSLCVEICDQIRAVGGTAAPGSNPGLILVNGNITAKVTFSTGHVWRNGETIWGLVLGKRPSADILIIARLRPPDRSIFDYYVIPALSRLHGTLHVRMQNNAPFLDAYNFSTLQPLIESFRRCPILEMT